MDISLVYHNGKSLREWKKLFEDSRFTFSYDELYQMMKEGVDFQKFLYELQGVIQ